MTTDLAGSNPAQFHVPTVDISAYVVGGTDEERAATAAAVDRACREVGFIQIIGHGIPQAAIDGLTSAMDDFFDLPVERKKAAVVAGVNRGYTPPKSEQLSLSLGVESATRMNDFFEAFNIGEGVDAYPDLDLPAEHYAENVWPADVPNFAERTLAWFARGGPGGQNLDHDLRRRVGVAGRLLRDIHRPFAGRVANEQLCVAAG